MTTGVDYVPDIWLARIIHGFYVAQVPSICQIGPRAAISDARRTHARRSMLGSDDGARPEMARTWCLQQGPYEYSWLV